MDVAPGDLLYLSPKVDTQNTLHMLSASVEKYRFVEGLRVSCAPAQGTTNVKEDVRWSWRASSEVSGRTLRRCQQLLA